MTIYINGRDGARVTSLRSFCAFFEVIPRAISVKVRQGDQRMTFHKRAKVRGDSVTGFVEFIV